jgi:polysaccharide biosynthesis protein PelF
VVSSDVGSCRELIEGGIAQDRDLGLAGEVVAIADPQATSRAILGLLRDPQRWQAAQASGLQRVHRYYGEKSDVRALSHPVPRSHGGGVNGWHRF